MYKTYPLCIFREKSFSRNPLDFGIALIFQIKIRIWLHFIIIFSSINYEQREQHTTKKRPSSSTWTSDPLQHQLLTIPTKPYQRESHTTRSARWLLLLFHYSFLHHSHCEHNLKLKWGFLDEIHCNVLAFRVGLIFEGLSGVFMCVILDFVGNCCRSIWMKFNFIKRKSYGSVSWMGCSLSRFAAC